MPLSSLDWDLIDRYLAGECTAEEGARVRETLAARPEEAGALEKIVHATTEGPSSAGFDQARLWNGIASQLNGTVATTDPAPQAERRRAAAAPVRHRSRGRIAGAISALAVAIVVGAGVATGTFATWFAPALRAGAQFSTQPGERTSMILPDGSAIMLNVASRIRYEAGFGITHRNVMVDGEVLFTVTQHSGLPFTVTTTNATTRVLGTVFSVRQYADDSVARVIVAGGKVGVENTVLTAGDAATIDRTGLRTLTHGNDLAAALGWENGRLDLVDVPMRDAIPMLQRWYGITITLSDAALADRIVATSLRNETAVEAVALLAAVLNATPRWNQQHVTFVPLAR